MTRDFDGYVADIPYLRHFKRQLDGPEEIRWLALPCGAALETDRGLLRLLCDGAKIDDELYPGWRGLLASHGVFAQ